MLALPGEAVGEACEGLRRSSHFECAPRFEGSIGYAWGLSSQGEAPALEGFLSGKEFLMTRIGSLLQRW